MARWVRYACADGGVGFGVIERDQILEHTGDIYGKHSPSGKVLPLASVKLLCPCAPSKIIALWNNFHALAAKLGKAAPKYPLFFIKPASCVVGPGAPIERPMAYAGKIVFEGELGIVIGNACTDVSVDEAPLYIHGYTCVNDVTAIEVLTADPDFPQWSRAKSYNTFGCIGPAVASGLDWSILRIVTKVDGTERQNYALSDMIFSPHELVSLLSHDMTLLQGDVIACGTSIGVGSIREGASVEIAIEGIGVLENSLARQR